MHAVRFVSSLRSLPVVASLLLAAPLLAQGRDVDLLITGGTLVDGTGAPARRADVGIANDRIVFVGDATREKLRGRRHIDATGSIVAPGFIDPHTHTLADLGSDSGRANLAYLMQGVTTVVTNNDGGGTLDIGATLDHWASSGIGTNAALYVGEGSVRAAVLGMSAATPTAAQLDSMRAIVRRGMRDGALGLSTGLYYAPGSYASTEEIIALARVAAEQGGIYDSHLRDEGSYTIGLLGAVREALRIGQEAGIPVHIAHIKALGTDVWGRSDSVVALIERARASGLEVTADQYPYLASGTSLSAALLPRWAEAGGTDSLRMRVADGATRARLVADMDANLRRRGGAASLLITSARDRTLVGKTLADVAAARGAAPVETALDIILAGGAGLASFNMQESDVDRFMTQPFVMTGSDGSTGHPRKYGTFPRKIRHYVYDTGLLTLPQAIHASSALAASALRLRDRGVVAPGKFADVIVFDPATYRDRATYEQPELLATGVRYVLVNGRVAVDRGRFTGVLAGRPLRRTGSDDGTAQLWDQAEVRRTAHGVPHIRARTLRAAGYALGYVQSEDYGARVAFELIRSRGELARWFGRDSIERDFAARPAYERAVATYPFVDRDTRDVYEGFAAGVNRYVALHPDEFPPHFDPRFDGYDLLARDVTVALPRQAARFRARTDTTGSASAPVVERPMAVSADLRAPRAADPPDEGSNAWAFAPSRTTSGHAILLRNPHLQWSAGYYEAHVVVPGQLDFYGDFRIGGPFGVIGGFNRDLGWSTTNNDPLLFQIYALDLDPARADHFLLDGRSLPIQRERVTVDYAAATGGVASESRESERTSFGPVVQRDARRIYVLRSAMDGDFRAGEQFLRMMRARSLAEWKEAMRMRARLNSSFTYADRAGHIYYLWNAAIPSLPHASGGDSVAIAAHRAADIWSHYVPFDSLPQVLDPPGGYIHNENDPPYYTNMRRPLDPAQYPRYFPAPRLGLRSQLALALIDNSRRLTMHDVLGLKLSYRMLLADRVRDDLVTAVRAAHPDSAVSRAIDMIARWDRTASPESQGGVLFELWWRRYVADARPDSMYAEPWSETKPTSTPRGIRFPERAAQAFVAAVEEATQRYGRADVAWGEVHRIRVGDVDLPAGGCNGDLGCFRVLWFRDAQDGKREAVGGDGWILAVEFGERPRARSVLAYGESDRADSPFHSDQAPLFARGEYKRVDWTPAEIERGTVRRYHPGAPR
ncbi:MAG TPA: penicillin acylase family protein [Gemmatimonadaceae bacterium]